MIVIVFADNDKPAITTRDIAKFNSGIVGFSENNIAKTVSVTPGKVTDRCSDDKVS